MMTNFKKNKNETNASATVVDGKLVLSLPDALSPVVWQMDLAHAKASALEVLHNEEKNQHSLSLKNPKGEKVEVAVFAQRSHAVEGLMAASSALESAHGQIRPGDDAHGKSSPVPAAPVKSKNIRGRLMSTLLALVILFIMFTIWSNVVPRPLTTGPLNTTSSAGSVNPQDSSGVPVSADDFLRGQ